LELDRGVHRDHPFLVDAAQQSFESGDRGWRPLSKVGPIEQHRVVAGKVAAVVVQCAQAVIGNLGVGRVQVGDVGITRGKRPISQVMLDATNVLLG
jgi:hypothetical protein